MITIIIFLTLIKLIKRADNEEKNIELRERVNKEFKIH